MTESLEVRNNWKRKYRYNIFQIWFHLDK